MHKKHGGLETWQWAAILAGIAMIYLVYEHSKNSAAAAATGAPSSTDAGGVIDPTTGLPYATEGGGGGTSGLTGTGSDSGTSLQQELSDLGAIQGLMANMGLGQTTMATGLSSSQTYTLNADLKKLNRTLGKQETALERLQKRVAGKPSAGKPAKRKTTASRKNPGHTVTTHPDGRKTVSSSAPHNGQQHKNIAPPSHQRATHRRVKT